MKKPIIIRPREGIIKRRTGVCLNMIVKNEAPVIVRALRSAQLAIDYFVIVDTGSTDGTAEIILAFAQEMDLPGEIHFRDWVNFGHNRQEALELALVVDACEWLLFLDADQELVCPRPTFFQQLEPGASYWLNVVNEDNRYALPSLANIRHSQWRWEGPVHECLKRIKGSDRMIHTDEAWILFHAGEGVRSRGISIQDKFLRDAALLEEALAKDPENRRNRFYLAQSYNSAGEFDKAYKNYERRTRMGGLDPETYLAQFEKAKLAIHLKLDHEVILQEIVQSVRMRPSRAEPLWLLARYCRSLGMFREGYSCAANGLRLPLPTDKYAIDTSVYDWRLKEELVCCAFALGRYEEAAATLKPILSEKKMPPGDRVRLESLLKNILKAHATRNFLHGKLFSSNA